MIRLRESIVVECSPEAAFAYLGDFTTTEEWDPGTPSAKQIDTGPVGVGTRYELVSRFRGKDSPIEYVVTAYDPPRRIVLQGDNQAVTSVDTITVAAAPSGCTVTYAADFTLKGYRKLAEPFVRGAFAELGKEGVEGMREHLTRIGQRQT